MKKEKENNEINDINEINDVDETNEINDIDEANETDNKKKTVKIKAKKKFSLDDYRKSTGVEEMKYKPDSWIPMSPAFRETTMLPGIPEGRLFLVYGKPDSGKSTLALEAIAGALKVGILPILINTEKKFSLEHAEKMGVKKDDILYVDSLESVENIALYIKERLKDQKNGDLPTDILIVVDSIGNVISDAEVKADEKGDSVAIMATAKIINQQFHRIIEKRISDTRKENFPYNATLLIINHAYTGTMANVLTPYGGEGLIKAATIVVRMGGILKNSSKCYAEKGGVKIAFAIQSDIVVEKNHITDIAVKDKIVCTPKGFIMNTKSALDEYKKQNKENWKINFEPDWE